MAVINRGFLSDAEAWKESSFDTADRGQVYQYLYSPDGDRLPLRVFKLRDGRSVFERALYGELRERDVVVHLGYIIGDWRRGEVVYRWDDRTAVSA